MANPALMVLRYDRFHAPQIDASRKRPEVGVSYRVGTVTEQRTRTVYDYYENAVGEQVVADNTLGTGLAGPIAVQYPVAGLSFGVGVGPAFDYGYEFRQEVRDDFYGLLGVRELLQSGRLMQGRLCMAYDFMDLVGIGAGFTYFLGERRLETRDVGDTAALVRSDRPQGMAPSLGLLIHPGTRLRLGLSFEPRAWNGLGLFVPKAESATRAPSPLQLRVGAGYFAPGPVPTAISGQVDYTDWHGVDTTWRAVIDLRAGVEHRLLDNLLLRYGFGLIPSARDASVQSGLVSLGTGLETSLGQIDVGAGLRRRVFGSDLLEPLPGTAVNIYQTSWEVALSVSRAF
jgi:hypothetical protein